MSKLALRQWARTIKRDAQAIYLAARDPRVPWYAKVLALCVAGYALSPIDLIPDFVPVLGYLDDLLIVPLGILAVVKLGPAERHGRAPSRSLPHSRKAGEPYNCCSDPPHLVDINHADGVARLSLLGGMKFLMAAGRASV